VKAEIIVPHVGETTTQVKILQWFKSEGDAVAKGEPLLEVETDKSVLTIEAYADGVLDSIIVPAGEEADSLQVIGLLESADAGLKVETEAAAAAAKALEERPQPAEPAPRAREAAPRRKGRRQPVSPVARKLAAKHGIDLSGIEGSGRGGMITADDVQQALDAAQALGAPAVPGEAVELSRMRQTIGRRMLHSKTTIPHFYVASCVDMSAAASLREELLPSIEEQSGVRLSYTHLMVNALALAATQFPTVNASYADDKLVLHDQVNVGIAVALENGLIAPVLRDAASKSLAQIAPEAAGLVRRARENKLTAEDVQGGTITLTNLGGADVEFFAAIINPPESVIVASGEVAPRPAVVDGEIVVRPMVTLVASGDHRVLDGTTLARFLQSMKALLERPSELVAGS
jgi:pyruvate dehydrogenase E2 component (dihydrolipoamide acetyltransferase)